MAKIIDGKNCPNMPWQDRPEGYEKPVWRYTGNPIIKRNPNKAISRAFNSAMIAYEGEFIGVFRGDTTATCPHLFLGRSKDGINIKIDETPISFVDESGNPCKETPYQYDPRLVPVEDAFYIIWCDDFEESGPTISIAKTTDFKTFMKYDRPFLPCNRNGVLFPRKVNGEFLMLSRPSDNVHTRFGDIFLSQSSDLTFWGKHRLVMKAGYEWWCGAKIGAGPAPIETDEGWLMFYHGVNISCNGYIYSMGVALLDKDDPSKVLRRTHDFLLCPEETYETTGYVGNVVFPTATITDAATGRIAIYYGAADTYTALAFTTVDTLLDFLKTNGR